MIDWTLTGTQPDKCYIMRKFRKHWTSLSTNHISLVLIMTEGGKDPSSSKLDHLTAIIGIFGPFHAVIYSIIGLTISMHTWQMMCNKFLTYPTDFWCQRPEMFQNLSLEEWLNISTPLTKDGKFDKCNIFDVDFAQISERPDETTTEVVPCQNWEFQSEHFDKTITERWNLVCGPMENFPRYVQIAFFIGNMAGVLLIGPFSDWYGRKTAYMAALTIWSMATIIGYFADDPYAWIITR